MTLLSITKKRQPIHNQYNEHQFSIEYYYVDYVIMLPKLYGYDYLEIVKIIKPNVIAVTIAIHKSIIKNAEY